MRYRPHRRRQRGAAMPIYVLALFPLVAAFYVVHGVGWKLTNRVRVQQAADRVAFTAATVTADGLNRVEFLNSALVTVKAMKSVIDGIKYAYGPLTGYDAVMCFFGSAHHCELFGLMVGNAGKVFDGISNNRDRLDDLHDLIAQTADGVVENTARHARQAAQRVAADAGVDGAVVVTYEHPAGVAGLPRLPLIEDEDGFGMRPLAMAGVFYGLHILPQQMKQFGSPDHALGFFGATAYFATQGSLRGFKGPKYDDARQQRSALAVTAVVRRDADDRAILGRMAASGARADGGLDALRTTDVAVARAEPYFSVAGGEPDGRPAWRARLRPLDLPFERAGRAGQAPLPDDLRSNHIDRVLTTRLLSDPTAPMLGSAGQIFSGIAPIDSTILVQ